MPRQWDILGSNDDDEYKQILQRQRQAIAQIYAESVGINVSLAPKPAIKTDRLCSTGINKSQQDPCPG